MGRAAHRQDRSGPEGELAVLSQVPVRSGSVSRRPTVIDGGDLACGELLMLVFRQTRSMPAGSLVEIVTTDPAAPLDIPAWCHLTRHHYRGPSPLAPPGRYLVELGAAPVDVDPQKPWHRTADDPSRSTRSPLQENPS